MSNRGKSTSARVLSDFTDIDVIDPETENHAHCLLKYILHVAAIIQEASIVASSTRAKSASDFS